MSLQVTKEILKKPTSKHQAWCFKQGYRIYPQLDGGIYRIVVDNGVKAKTGDMSYSKKEIDKAIWELYLKIYDRWHELKDTVKK